MRNGHTTGDHGGQECLDGLQTCTVERRCLRLEPTRGQRRQVAELHAESRGGPHHGLVFVDRSHVVHSQQTLKVVVAVERSEAHDAYLAVEQRQRLPHELRGASAIHKCTVVEANRDLLAVEDSTAHHAGELGAVLVAALRLDDDPLVAAEAVTALGRLGDARAAVLDRLRALASGTGALAARSKAALKRLERETGKG